MELLTNWQPYLPFSLVSLDMFHVHVWRIPLGSPSLPINSCRVWLSPEELARADRFTNVSAQRQFVVTRGVLRQLLGRYAGVTPTEIQLKKTSEGKPYAVFPTGVSLGFNVSHTKGLALVAISGGVPVGIDVEAVDRTVNAESLAKRFFAEREAQQLADLEEDQRAWRFLTYWTCKEAFLKLQGTGLGTDLSKFVIDLDMNKQAVAIVGLPSASDYTTYTLWRINPGEGFVGALAVGAYRPEIIFFDWNPESVSHKQSS